MTYALYLAKCCGAAAGVGYRVGKRDTVLIFDIGNADTVVEGRLVPKFIIGTLVFSEDGSPGVDTMMGKGGVILVFFVKDMGVMSCCCTT